MYRPFPSPKSFSHICHRCKYSQRFTVSHFEMFINHSAICHTFFHGALNPSLPPFLKVSVPLWWSPKQLTKWLKTTFVLKCLNRCFLDWNTLSRLFSHLSRWLPTSWCYFEINQWKTHSVCSFAVLTRFFSSMWDCASGWRCQTSLMAKVSVVLLQISFPHWRIKSS